MGEINANVKAIHQYLAEIDAEIEVTFDMGGIVIYWENLRVKVSPSDFKKAIDPIKKLVNLQAYFE